MNVTFHAVASLAISHVAVRFRILVATAFIGAVLPDLVDLGPSLPRFRGYLRYVSPLSSVALLTDYGSPPGRTT